jgi:hypothetical protein
MADYDSNIIKPVEGLPNIAGISGAKGREQRKRRQHLPDETAENTQRERHKSTDEQNPHKSGTDKNKSDRDAIDYCA